MNLKEKAMKKLILEKEIPSFLENHYSFQEIESMVQTERRLVKKLLPQGIQVIDMAYCPTDEEGKPLPHSPFKRIQNRLFIPKSLWYDYLSSQMVTKVEIEVVERFTFREGRELRNLVILEQKKRKISLEEAKVIFDRHKRRSFISITKKGNAVNKRFTVKGFNLCQHILIHTPHLPSSKIYYDTDHLSWVFNTGLHKTNYITAYNEDFSTLSREDRFYRYLSTLSLDENEGIFYKELTGSPDSICTSEEKQHYMNTLLARRYRCSPEEKASIDHLIYSLMGPPIEITIKR